MIEYQYLTQWENYFYPSSSCVLTCLAMALSEPNKIVKPDELYLAAKQRNWDRLLPETFDNLSKLYRKPYRIKKDLIFEEIQPGAIIYGGWTAGGHCVLVTERTELGLTYNDPLGFFDGKKYDYNRKGESLNVGRKSVTKYIGQSGEIWGHLPIPIT